ncbi:MAG: ECF transporter S component [Clostridia bacterium]|nr:ECF transporter S component [Clostridia bacterium]
MANTKVRQMAQLAILIAIVLVMAFTPLGYLRIGTLSITFLTIPVAIGAVILGPSAGALLGFIFGMTSFLQCFGLDAFGTALMAVSPLCTFLMCVGTRTLMGWLAGLIFRLLNRGGPVLRGVATSIACVSCPVLNTLFFMSTLYLFFGRSGAVLEAYGSMTFFGFIFTAVTINSILELVATLVVGTVICTTVQLAVRHSR